MIQTLEKIAWYYLVKLNKYIGQEPEIIFLGIFPSKSLTNANLEIYILSFNFMLIMLLYPIVHMSTFYK